MINVDNITTLVKRTFFGKEGGTSNYLDPNSVSFSCEVSPNEWDRFFERSSRIVGIILVASFVVGSGLVIFRKREDAKLIDTRDANSKEIVLSSTTSAVTPEIVVDIQGAVFKPSVYRLNEGSRIEDIINLSGGLTSSADKMWVDRYINKAEKLKDGQKIYIPKIGETAVLREPKTQALPSSTSGPSVSSKVNINYADSAALDRLPGISKTTAGNIISYREKYGRFANISDIQKVKGIKSGVFGKIKELITTD